MAGSLPGGVRYWQEVYSSGWKACCGIRMRKPILAAILAILATILACRMTPSEPRRLELYPSPTVLPTQTERVIVHTSTPLSTYTPIVIEVTSTPEPEGYLCVTASEAVYLRPSPGVDNYPITPLPLGARLTDFGGRDLGGREEEWAFVQFGSRRGWVNLSYVQICE